MKSLLTFALLLAGLASPARADSYPPLDLPAGALAVPHVIQATEYSCGAASLLSVLLFWNAYDGGELSLHSRLGTTEKNGTAPWAMESVARQQGLQATWRENMSLSDLDAAVAGGDTVIIDYQAWSDRVSTPGFSWRNEWESGHYSVVIATTPTNIYLMDPSTYRGYGYVTREELPTRWHDYEFARGGQIYRFHGGALIIRGKEALERYPHRVQHVD